jgi:hypothetical protein
MKFSINLLENFVHVPAPIGLKASTFTTYFPSTLQAKPIYPKTNRFMTYIDSAFMQYIFAYMDIGKGRKLGAEASTSLSRHSGESSVDDARNTSRRTG